MKIKQPTDRQQELQEALEYCSLQQQLGRKPYFTVVERWMINQERSRLFQEDFSWQQLPNLEFKIEIALKNSN